jgi:large subunit ribosomal protein L30
VSLVITQVKSANGTNGRQRDTLRSLGLRGIGKSVEREDSPQLRGMVHAVRHLVEVRGLGEAQTGDERSEAVK